MSRSVISIIMNLIWNRNHCKKKKKIFLCLLPCSSSAQWPLALCAQRQGVHLIHSINANSKMAWYSTWNLDKKPAIKTFWHTQVKPEVSLFWQNFNLWVVFCGGPWVPNLNFFSCFILLFAFIYLLTWIFVSFYIL